MPQPNPDARSSPTPFKVVDKIIEETREQFGEHLSTPALSHHLDRLSSRSNLELTETQRHELAELERLSADLDQDNAFAASFKQDASFEIHVARDGMAVYLDIQPVIGKGREVSSSDVAQALIGRGVRIGVDVPTVRAAVEQARQRQTVTGVRIVRGKRPTPGEPDRIRRFGRRTFEGERIEIEPASADEEVWYCHEGDLLLEITPGAAGAAGFDIFHKSLPPPKHPPLHVRPGRHVEQSQGAFTAQSNGIIEFDGQCLSVRSALVLKRDVTPADSPLVFDGEVHIHGAVRDGAEIWATGLIAIHGSVEAASVNSSKGAVELRSGIIGRGRGVIRAATDIHAKFAENASLFARRDIHLKVGSMHSRLVAGRSIYARQGRGQLLGGSILACRDIEVKQLGGPGNVVTAVVLGLPRHAIHQLGQIDRAINRLNAKIEDLQARIERIHLSIGDPRKLAHEHREAYLRLRQLNLLHDLRRQRFHQRRADLLNRDYADQSCELIVHRQSFGRIQIQVGGTVYSEIPPNQPFRILRDADAPSPRLECRRV